MNNASSTTKSDLLQAMRRLDEKDFHSLIAMALSERREMIGFRLQDPEVTKNYQSVISKGLVNYRLKEKISQLKLAKKLGVTRHQIIRWESGKTVPNNKHYNVLKELKII